MLAGSKRSRISKMNKRLICILMIFGLLFNIKGISYAENNNSNEKTYVKNVNPYYNYWKNEFIVFIDNYTGDINNVSEKDLLSGNGTSRIYIFSKLKNDNYTYDDLIYDMQNFNINTNLHDLHPILVHLPKSAASNESHIKFENANEKGKLVEGGPYSKYAKYPSGFYYKGKKCEKDEINKILSDYKKEAQKISDMLNQIKKISIKDLYPNANVAYFTNGATTTAGTPDAKIYLLDLDEKHSPYKLSAVDLFSKDVISGEATKGVLPTWSPETMYIYNSNQQLIEELTFETFQQYLWSKQDQGIIDWLNSFS